ncbi:hypothetical protein ACM614_03770, partial [Streptomyces sp. 12297]
MTSHPTTLAFVESPVQLLNVLEWAYADTGPAAPAPAGGGATGTDGTGTDGTGGDHGADGTRTAPAEPGAALLDGVPAQPSLRRHESAQRPGHEPERA